MNDPIHANPITRLGKAVMSHIGLVQPLALLAAGVIIGFSALLPARARRRALTLALVPLAYIARRGLNWPLMQSMMVPSRLGLPELLPDSAAGPVAAARDGRGRCDRLGPATGLACR
jgi:hypothetical protein